MVRFTYRFRLFLTLAVGSLGLAGCSAGSAAASPGEASSGQMGELDQCGYHTSTGPGDPSGWICMCVYEDESQPEGWNYCPWMAVSGRSDRNPQGGACACGNPEEKPEEEAQVGYQKGVGLISAVVDEYNRGVREAYIRTHSVVSNLEVSPVGWLFQKYSDGQDSDAIFTYPDTEGVQQAFTVSGKILRNWWENPQDYGLPTQKETTYWDQARNTQVWKQPFQYKTMYWWAGGADPGAVPWEDDATAY